MENTAREAVNGSTAANTAAAGLYQYRVEYADKLDEQAEDLDAAGRLLDDVIGEIREGNNDISAAEDAQEKYQNTIIGWHNVTAQAYKLQLVQKLIERNIEDLQKLSKAFSAGGDLWQK